MKFNKFLWETYKNSTDGQNIINIFQNFKEFCVNSEKIKDLQKVIQNIQLNPDDDIDFEEYFSNMVKNANYILENWKPIFKSDNDSKDVLDNLWDAVPEEDIDKEEPRFLFSIDDIEYVSSVMYLVNPEIFFPYYFNRQFYLFENICNEFGIFLPAIPKKNDYTQREDYYWELCNSLREFRYKFEMTPSELAAFLYGYAPNVVKRYFPEDNHENPKKAYFVGGGVNNNGDFEYLDQANEKSVYSWQCNPDAQPGDIIVMYCVTPRSYVHSFWRAVTPGFIDPFFHFYRTTYIGQPILTKTIPLSEIKNDSILSMMPLVRGNMQGINGRVIEKKYYDRILEILKNKGQNIEILPKLENIEIVYKKLKNERDVELHLLEPLLTELGYKKEDWKRQVSVKMGRDNKIIPDYLLLPDLEKGNEKAFWVWEAKYTIPNHKQLKKDFDQAKSYGLRMQCKGIGLVSKEGIWLKAGKLDFNKILYWSWKQIKERDHFNDIFDIVGKK